ncbi:MAG: malate/lactate/ureidoglycolate dehydrogenase [Proteobacteria bacterium]|nr:malate/lactate/ureidoglycolate dehydrogenase [Pseudomonadota bacterium]
MLFAAEELRAFVRAVCAAGGSSAAESAAVAENLVEANLQGHDSHGVGMLPSYIANMKAGQLKVNQHAEVISDRGAIAVIDGKFGYGQVIGAEAMAIGIAKAQKLGMALVALRNAHHLGRIGAWAERCIGAGLVSMHYVNVIGVPARVAPHGGRDARLGTNPVCIGVPGPGGRNIMLDMATSIIAMGKTRVAANKGVPAPPDCLIDAEGRPTTDANVMWREPFGALLPFGTYKGFGLSVACDLLAGALTGGGTVAPHAGRPKGIINHMLSVIIDPAALGDSAGFAQEVERYIAWVTSSRPRGDGTAVMVAGDPERKTRVARSAVGIEIDSRSWAEIIAAGKSVGVDIAAVRAAAPGQRAAAPG